MNKNNKTNNQAQPDYTELSEYIEKCNELLERLPELALPVNIKNIIDNIVKRVEELVKADHAHVRVINWIENKLELVKYDEKNASERDIGLKYNQFVSLEVEQAIGGRVFRNKTSEIIPDVQKDKDFESYLDEIRKEPQLQNLVEYLKKIGPAVVVPLLLQNKAIGVLTVLRLREAENANLPLPFSENDRKILKHFAAQAAIALLNAWLLEAATWQPLQKESKGILLTVQMLCEAVVTEAKKITGAPDGKVRFVDWKGKRLVPGTLLRRTDDTICALRRIGVCIAGLAAKNQASYMSNNLQEDKDFMRFFDYAKSCKESFQEQLEALKNLQISIKGGKYSFSDTTFNEFREKWPEAYEKLEERLNVLKELPANMIVASLETHIKVLKGLANAWQEYVAGELEKWNSEIAVPILLGKKLLGVLNVHSQTKEWFTESDQVILQALAARVATAIIEHQQDVLKELQKIEQIMTAEQSFERVASMIADGIKNFAFFAGPDSEKIFPLLYICKTPIHMKRLLNEQQNFGEKFDPRQRESALPEEIQLLKVPIRNNGLGWEAIKRVSEKPKEPVFIVRENVNDPVSCGSETAQEYGVKTTACLPLVFRGIVYGLLYIHIKDKHFFTELEKDTLTLFAARAAIVVKNLKKLSEEKTYDDYFGKKLIDDCIQMD